jgi:ribosomal protein L18
MLKKPTAIAMTVLTLSLTGAALSAELAQASASAHTLRFTSVETAQKVLSKGHFVATDKDVESGKTVGFDVANGLASSKSASLIIDVAVSTHGGLIYGHCRQSLKTGALTGTVTGGTGKFRGAAGTITGHSAGNHGQNQAIVITYH